MEPSRTSPISRRTDKIVTDTWNLDRVIDAFRAAADRSVVSAHVVFK